MYRQLFKTMLNENVLNEMLEASESKECTPSYFIKNFNLLPLTDISPDDIEAREKFYNEVYVKYYDLWYSRWYLGFDDITNWIEKNKK